MRKIRKLFAGLLAGAMVLAMSTAVFGATEVPAGSTTETKYTDQPVVTIRKAYKLENPGTTSPAETFNLRQTAKRKIDGEASTVPDLVSIQGASYTAGAATTGSGTISEIRVTLPTYERVGVYEYTLQEVTGSTAGVSYYAGPIRLVVTVIQQDGIIRVAAVHTEEENGTKSDTFTNIYRAGELAVKKTVEGLFGDVNKYFAFKVTLTGERGKTYGGSYPVSRTTYSENPGEIEIGKETTFYLKHDETIHISNLPYGVTYRVEEITPSDYKLKEETNTSGTIGGASVTASFVNEKQGTIDMGVATDNLPYVILFAVVVLGAGSVLLFRNKKRQH